jgi:2-dehydro-3-deoxygluconokinase
MSVAKSCDFGMAANAIKHSIPGDINHATVAEVLELMDGSMGGKVKR